MSGTKLQMKRDTSHSNLNIFKEGKSEIIKIYGNIYEYVKECNKFLSDLQSSGKMFEVLLKEEDATKISHYQDKIKSIQSVVSRNQMKCAFFGRTSNGKSTTINAMLGEKILPAGLGHTTSCFLEIQGTEEDQGFLMVTYPSESGDTISVPAQQKPIESISELASDLSAKKVSVEALIKIFWPNKKCSLLSEDVVLIDSPGIDVEVDIDKWIDICCLDADVFVYVANAESTINISEKKFFFKVKDKLSKPNIFIVNNRWDASANEDVDTAEMAKKQHMEKFVSFLTKELKICSKSEAESRVFFVSAKEALINRTRNSGSPYSSINNTPDPKNTMGDNSFSPSASTPTFASLTDGWQNRYFEFCNFEKHLEKVLSESATKTKFASHSSQGQDVVSDIKAIMENLFEHCQEQRNCAVTLTHRLQADIDRLSQSQKEAVRLSLNEINQLSSRCAEKVAQTLREELRRLVDLVGRYDGEGENFSEERERLVRYKQRLSQFVERELTNNLEASCSEDLYKHVCSVSRNIVNRYVALTTDKQVQEQIRRCLVDDFRPEFRIDCHNYHSDFQEDLSFRFSLGPTALLQRVLGFGGSSTSSANTGTTVIGGGLESFSTLLSLRNRLPAISGKLALVGIIGGGVLFKTVSWRVLGAVAAVYGGLYLYEYSMWNSNSREKLFKMQYARYLSEKLRLTMDSTSRHSAMQPQVTLKAAVKGINSKLDDQLGTMNSNMQQYQKDIEKLQDIVNSSKGLRNKATFLENNIKEFEERFLD